MEFCYKYWSQWTEDSRLEILRMNQEYPLAMTHKQRMTLLNVELLSARLTQVRSILVKKPYTSDSEPPNLTIRIFLG